MRRNGSSKRGAGRREKGGRTLWLLIVCAGLLCGSSTARLTGQLIVENVVRSVVNPVCGLTAYTGAGDGETFWQCVLREILSVPLPMVSYAAGSGAGGQETAVTDPVYDRYLSSEVLYSGAGDSLLTGGNGQSGDSQSGNSQNSGESGDSQSGNSQNSGRPGDSQSGNSQNGSPGGDESAGTTEVNGSGQGGSLAAVKNHLPDNITGKLYTLDQLDNFNYLVKQLYFVHSSTTVYPSQLDASELLSKDLTIDRQTEGAQILIHHTHGTEDFEDSVEGAGMTIMEVGDYLTELLEGYGYKVIHDRSVYAYDTAYSEANARVQEILAANPSIQVVIDLHRDATASRKRYTVEMDGEEYAPLMFFNGMCQTPDGPIDYLSNPCLEENLAFSLKMKLIAEAYYPGLTRANFLKAYQYNQHLMPRYTLVEAGFDTNTFEEVCRSMVPLAKILDAVLNDPDAVPLAGDR